MAEVMITRLQLFENYKKGGRSSGMSSGKTVKDRMCGRELSDLLPGERHSEYKRICAGLGWEKEVRGVGNMLNKEKGRRRVEEIKKMSQQNGIIVYDAV